MGDRPLGERAMLDVPQMHRRAPSCPAALMIRGATDWDQGVVCRAMEEDVAAEPGVDMTAAALGFMQNEATGGVYLSLKSDPSSVMHFCHGTAVPVDSDQDIPGGRASYTYCPVWQAAVQAKLEGRERLVEDEEPEVVEMGIADEIERAAVSASTLDAADPWAQARRDLDLLAPPAGVAGGSR